MEILTLGQKIKKLRKEKNLTLKELAGNRITAAQISHIERDKSYPSQDLLEYFANRLNVTVDYLVESKEMQARKLTTNLILKSDIYIKSKQLKKAKEEIEKAIQISKDYDIHDNYAKAKYIQGLVLFIEQNYEKAIQSLEESLMFNVKIGNIEEVVKCYIKLGEIYISDKIYKVAITKLLQAENVFESYNLNNYELKKEIYINISYCYAKLEENTKCLDYAKKAEQIQETLNNIKDKGNDFLITGSKFLNEGDYDKAKEYLSKAMKIFEKENEKNKQAQAYIKMSKAYTKLERHEEALEYIKKAYIIKREYEDEEVVSILFEYIKKLIIFKDFENAKKYAKKALAISIKIKDTILEYKSLKYYARVYKQEGNSQVAIETMKKALEIIRSLEDKKELANAYFYLAEIYSDISSEEKLKYYSEGVNLYKELGLIND
ncbi:Tetratricopeptide repeat-containing protein [Alkalithermobacter thermoalcaliphilus JW-YL-7 = DSM 7308]|uniref:Tetratricopeptide repeat-containing protein n=1 Tax=Alkalithermobacter thermoalcaliphilus JW-YL-7 = DSM 7308 TaxID=1121328 RepID=A0A150FT14_CLOPD|nr:Tetratricopeptide repeat-containing protein [[Clostridium] paradoxum JW-YL-7 = DSM 7308]SHL08940.1 Tetratricopeptide repeat-containing protein [[Clostridium] paradoxum JW-YL-7 = DSM 7308]